MTPSKCLQPHLYFHDELYRRKRGTAARSVRAGQARNMMPYIFILPTIISNTKTFFGCTAQFRHGCRNFECRHCAFDFGSRLAAAMLYQVVKIRRAIAGDSYLVIMLIFPRQGHSTKISAAAATSIITLIDERHLFQWPMDDDIVARPGMIYLVLMISPTIIAAIISLVFLAISRSLRIFPPLL